MSLNDKLKQVMTWLEHLYGGEEIPEFEVNERTIEILHSLMVKNETKNRETQLVTDDLNQKTTEYTAEAQRLNRVLSDVNLTSSSLSQSGVASLRTVASVALLLQTKDASDTSFLLAMDRLEAELERVRDDRVMEQQSLARLVVKTRVAFHQNANLHRVLKSLEAQQSVQKKEMQQQNRDIGFLHAKTKTYKQDIKKKQAHLRSVGADESIMHQSLVSQSQSLQSLKERIVQLQTKLESYQELPPNISEAKVKIEGVKQQIAALEEELTKVINLIHV